MASPRTPAPPAQPTEQVESAVHFRPPRRRYTQPSTLMTLSRFAPMIDLSFLLLIFFLATTRFAEPEGLFSAAMPRVAFDPSSVALPISPIVLRLAGDDKAVSITVDRFDGAPQSFAELPSFLREIHQKPGFDTNTPLIIIASDDVTWDDVVGAWNASVRAGCKQIAFAEP